MDYGNIGDGCGKSLAFAAVLCAVAGYLVIRAIEWLCSHVHLNFGWS